MDELLKALPSLFGVLVGGLITFFIQRSMISKQQLWEREKMELDYYNKREAKKFEVFNKILHMNSKYPVIEFDMHSGFELNKSEYDERVRPLLYEIYHLLDEAIIDEVESIEDISDRQGAEEEEREGDREALAANYMKILKLIKNEFKKLRENERNLMN